jgi:hypothetical protein
MSGEVIQGPQIAGINGIGNTTYTPIKATVFQPGELRVKEESSQQFVDTFDILFDTTNNWNTAVTGNGGVAFTFIGAAISGGSGVSNSGYSYVTSRNKFQPRAPGFNELFIVVNLTFPYVTTARQFWGVGNIVAAPAIPAANAFMNDAFGFEIQEGTGKMFAVTYSGGTRFVIADLSSTGTNAQPNDAKTHKYFITYRGDYAIWAIDNRDNIVAIMPDGSAGPNVNSLPICIASVSTATGTTNAPIQVNAATMGDTGRNNAAVSDGAFPWRIQTVYPSAASYSAQVNTEGQRATYRYAITGFTPVATPTAFVVLQGSATKVVRIKRIYLSGTTSAATGGNQPLVGTRRSTAGTLGSAVLTAVPGTKHDINDVAATGVVSTVGTANYTTMGTTAGQLLANRIGLATATTGTADSPAVYDFATRNDKPLILRGVSDFITLEGGAAALPAGAVFDIEIETEEDTY